MENEYVKVHPHEVVPTPSTHAMNHLKDRLERFESFLERRSFPLLVTVLIVLSFIKHGPRMYMTFGDSLLNADGPETEFPTIAFGRWLLIARLLHIPNRLAFEVLTLFVSMAILALIAYLLHKSLPRPSSVVAFTAIALGQIGLVLTSQFGSADQFLLLGATLLALTGRNNWALWVVGAIFLAVGNPGQALVASISLFLLSQIATFRVYRARSMLTIAFSLVWLALDTLLTQANQADAIDAGLTTSLFVSLVAGPFRIYSMYGALWFLVIAVILSSSRRSIVWLSIALVALPFAFVLSTTDGMRVGVGATSLVLLALIRETTTPITDWIQRTIGAPMGLSLLILLVVPSLNLLGLDVVLPWDWVQHEIRFWIEVSRQ